MKAPRTIGRGSASSSRTSLPALVSSVVLALGVFGCGAPTAPDGPLPALEEVEWRGVVFSATSHVRGDTVLAELVARNPRGEAIELELPVRDCMGYVRLYAEGDWDQPVLETMDPFGVWCGSESRDQHVALEVQAGDSFSDASWVYAAWPVSALPSGRYRAAVLIRPGYLEDSAAPAFLLQAGATFERP